ncbi:MAG: Zn-dependent hydrolase [Bacteroidales bacterium]|nr:Zn-dependent hydrolase [Bacteroidales bacterium]
MRQTTIYCAALAIALTACGPKPNNNSQSTMQQKVDEFALVELKADIGHLADNDKQMLGLLFEAAQIMDDIFWTQAYGDKEQALSSAADEATREFIRINYGPWERLNGNEPFVDGVGKKPLGAQFYPTDMTQDEFEAFEAPDKTSLYTIIRRDANGQLQSIPYHQAYKPQIDRAAELIAQAAQLADEPGLKAYLESRAQALLTDEYFESDIAWMSMKDNKIDFVVGPTENYEDALFGYKAAHEAFILIKDLDWTAKIARFSALLPELQKSLPVEPAYKSETPGMDSDLGVYDVVFYGGDCNAGSKTIAINLPNDPRVHLEKGSRKLQLKNAMRYKFDKILLPIADLLIDEDQRANVKFDAFFENVMFHEVAHGLGIKNLVSGEGTVRSALKDRYNAIEEGKADILGLFMVQQLAKMGEIEKADMMDNYVTFVAGIFRSVRFGTASAHGKANMVCFNYLRERGAFSRNPETNTYRVDRDKMATAMAELARDILTYQGNGDYEGVSKLFNEKAVIGEQLRADLQRVAEANIPRDLRYKQGRDMLGL